MYGLSTRKWIYYDYGTTFSYLLIGIRKAFIRQTSLWLRFIKMYWSNQLTIFSKSNIKFLLYRSCKKRVNNNVIKLNERTLVQDITYSWTGVEITWTIFFYRRTFTRIFRLCYIVVSFSIITPTCYVCNWC